MSTPQEEAAIIVAAAMDRQTVAIEAQTVAMAANNRAAIIGALYGQLVSNVAFRNTVRVPRINQEEKAQVATLADTIIEA